MTEIVAGGLYPQGSLFGDTEALRKLTDEQFLVAARELTRHLRTNQAQVRWMVGRALADAFLRWGEADPYRRLVQEYSDACDVTPKTLWRWRSIQERDLGLPAHSRRELRAARSSVEPSQAPPIPAKAAASIPERPRRVGGPVDPPTHDPSARMVLPAFPSAENVGKVIEWLVSKGAPYLARVELETLNRLGEVVHTAIVRSRQSEAADCDHQVVRKLAYGVFCDGCGTKIR